MNTSRHEKGMVLVVALIMLLLLTMLSVSAMNSTTLQEHMSANSHDYALAFAASEAGVRDAENLLGSPAMAKPPKVLSACLLEPPCTFWTMDPAGLWDTSKTGAGQYRDTDPSWWADNAFGASNSLPLVVVQPRYVVDYIGKKKTATRSLIPDPGADLYEYYYDVTGRGTARGSFAAVITQSVYARVW